MGLRRLRPQGSLCLSPQGAKILHRACTAKQSKSPLSLGQLHCAPHTPHFLASDVAATWLTKPALLKGCTSKRVAEPGLQRSTKAAQTRQEGPLPPCSLCTLSGSARRRQHTSVPPRFACKDYNERRSHAKRTDGHGHPVLLSELRQGSQLAAVERSGLPDCTPR